MDEVADADINRSGLARPRSLPYSDLNESLDDLKNSQKIEDLTNQKIVSNKCSGQCENLFKTEKFLGVRCTLISFEDSAT